jgi:hypothetical protein
VDKFLEKLNEEAEALAKEYLVADDIDKAEVILEEVNIRLSILANAQSLKTSTLTADFTQQMQEQAKNIDFSKLDLNDLMKQLGNLK